MFYVIDYLKALACLLILNFHSEPLYPDNLSVLAFGGDFGNNIFFAVSGFTLFSSISQTKFSKFFQWYGKRLIKLFPILVIFYICSISFGFYKIINVQEFVEICIFPTPYWFTGAILVFYPLLFIFGKIEWRFTFFAATMILFVLYFIVGGQYAERYVIVFFAMTAGYTLRSYLTKNEYRQLKVGIQYVIALILALIGYIGFKLLLMKGIDYYGIVMLFVGLMTVLLAIILIYCGYVKNEQLRKISEKHKFMYRFVVMMSKVTLPVYLLQVFGNRLIIKEINNYFMFPISLLLCFVSIILVAWLITQADGLIRSLFQNRRVKQ